MTKSSSESNLGDEIGSQVMLGHRAMFTGALILLLMTLVPGLPKIPFLLMAALVFVLVSRAKQERNRLAARGNDGRKLESRRQPETSPDESNLDQFLQHDRIVVEIGAGLIHLVEPKKGKGHRRANYVLA